MKPLPGVRIIVADTGPLIALSRLNRLQLLAALFSKIHIPQVVLSEATVNTEYVEAEPILSFAMKHASVEKTIDNDFNRRLLATLDAGEAQAIVLARELRCGVLMDEKRGRQVAMRRNIPVVGVLGVLLQAKHEGYLEELKSMLLQLQNSGYRLSEELVERVLELAGES
jgi:predicted nucleic acid-binding protein